MSLDDITYSIRGAAFKVHRELGPGLLESAYENCLCYEMRQMGLRVDQQAGLPLTYYGIRLEVGYRIDLLVEDQVLLELKAIEKLDSVHTAQMLTYLRLSGKKLGMLINFNTQNLQHGIKRFVM
ncbi:GxxExxY protein [Neolewinella xylanilytica]|uniref:GxxExxY protein n=1 Tax=Neolewinella xylanilytica TaxID=1514080 RepID=A0A2S6I3G2_9BACT|nr:GxxExxY protein [Neolewinella xylanilytica]PPK85611.1 GxxExxY protein [Neolewinella xylanilytica]